MIIQLQPRICINEKQISLLFDHQVYFKNSILLDNNIKTSYPEKENYNDLIKEILTG